jgi:glycosyltransferase involved in cell wall biosynthesis
LSCPVPSVVSVHDVSYLERPEFFPAARAWQLRHTVARTVREAARVLTVSEFSRRAIERAYGLDGSKIVVVPNGVSSMFRPLARENAAAFVHKRFQIPGPYVLTVGDLQPRKNQIGLINAFESAVRHARVPHRLVLVGKDTWHGREVRQRAARSAVADRIHFTGFVSDQELLQLYGGCDTFVFPSFYEGFGIPILEAMACGRAVACSNTSAMPEVANAAAILFNPHSKEEMARALVDLAVDSQLRGRMERLGQQRSTLFSWERAARQTLAVYYDIAGHTADSASQQQKSVGILS